VSDDDLLGVIVDSEVRVFDSKKVIVDSEVPGATLQKLIVDM